MTCDELGRRERELLAESDGGALARLGDERKAIEARLASQADEQIRRSLQGALTAIDEQVRQRQALRLTADRLDAEHTRLLYTLEGLAAQLVRLRSAGAEAGRVPRIEVEQGVTQLKSELDAIAQALEDMAVPPPSNELASPAGDAQGPGPRVRTR